MIFSVFQKNWVFGYSWSTLQWYRCYYLHRSRDALYPVCGILSCKILSIFTWLFFCMWENLPNIHGFSSYLFFFFTIEWYTPPPFKIHDMVKKPYSWQVLRNLKLRWQWQLQLQVWEPRQKVDKVQCNLFFLLYSHTTNWSSVLWNYLFWLSPNLNAQRTRGHIPAGVRTEWVNG